MTANKWPDPTTGYHWLKCKSEKNSGLEIFYWDQESEMFCGIGDVGCVDKSCFSEHWEYHGPVLTPDQIKEIRREERERIKKMIHRACDLGNIITSRQRDMIVAGIDSEAVIREMGDAP